MKHIVFNPRIVAFLLAILLHVMPATAQDKPVKLLASPTLEGPSMGSGWSHNVQLSLPTSTQYDESCVGIVKLAILPNKAGVALPSMTNIDVVVLVKVYDGSGFTTPCYQANNTLQIKYLPYSNQSYKDQDYLMLNSLSCQKIYRIETSIVSVNVNGVPGNLPNNVAIESSIDYLRYDYFNAFSGMNNPIITFQDYDCDGNNESIKVNWTSLAGATGYDLEWCVVNDFVTGAPNTRKTLVASDFDFKLNSTRISTKNNSYLIPNVFDRGVIACRLRAHGRPNNSSSTELLPEVFGAWSGTVMALVNHFEKDKNWQYNASYAEDGKFKTVVDFADGSLRKRQSVTQNNSDHTTIVGQTIYDMTGRPAVNILPAPLPPANCSNAGSDAQYSFKYHPNFAITTSAYSNLPFSKYHIDVDQGMNSCSSAAIPLATTSIGASQYYSPANPDQSKQQAYVPDAEGFPYSQTEYTKDNTGRIKRQGGVGPEFQLGSGHETKYFYGAPEQIELDRLFGSEVGDASHYQKNMVIDGNGQISVTYVDMNGKTVATALAGSAPTNLDNLATQPTVASTLTADMLNKDGKGQSKVNVVNSQGEAIEFTKSILVNTYNSLNSFTYNLSVEPFTFSCNPGLCFSCIYDLDIKITDDCGTPIYNFPLSGRRMVGDYTILPSGDTTFKVSCSTPSTYTFETKTTPAPPGSPITLNPGVYYVTKTLKINKQARDYYLSEYLKTSNNTCIKDLAWYENQELLKLPPISNCQVNCQSCKTDLGSKDEYVSKGRGTEAEWELLYKRCSDLCNLPKTSCDISLNMLTMDMAPNGQYGNWTNPNDPLSVYNVMNLLPKNVSAASVQNAPVTVLGNSPATWRHPKLPSGVQEYQDNSGQRSRIKLIKLPPQSTYNPGGYHLQVDNVLNTYTAGPGNYYTYPEHLANVSDFVANWKASWAKSLVTYHPEYCYYEDCANKFGANNGGNSISSNDFDAALLSTNTFSDALLSGLISMVSNVYVFNTGADPANSAGYFGTAFNSATPLLDVYTFYNNSLGQMNMSQFAAYMHNCGSLANSSTSSFGFCTTFGAGNSALQNKQWNTFKGLYLAEKNKLCTFYSDKKRIASNGGCEYYNGCIGNANFNVFNSPLVQYNSNNSISNASKYLNGNQPCNKQMKDLYAGKTKRFGNINDPAPLDKDEADYQLYLQSGQCPVARDFMAVLNGLAKNYKLSASTEALQNYQEFTVNLYNYLNNLPNPPANYVGYLWQQASLSANVLVVNIKNSVTNAITKTITFNPPPAGINWAQVVGISQLGYTGNTAAISNFTCVAKETNGNTFLYKTISGSTSFDLGGCVFKDVCKPNDLAYHMQSLMSALASSNLNIGVSDLFNTAGVSIGSWSPNATMGAYLQKIQGLVAPSVASPNLIWKYNNNNQFEVYDISDPSCKLKINLLSITPGVLNAGTLNQIVSFTNIKSAYNNYFMFEARGAANNLIGEIKGEVIKDCGGKLEYIGMGDCAKPDPAECRTKYHKNKKDLEALVTDIIMNRKYSPVTASPNNNVLNYASLSNNLIGNFNPLASNIPVNLSSAVDNSYYQVLNQGYVAGTGIQNDSIGIVFKSPCVNGGGGNGGPLDGVEHSAGGDPCNETTYCKLWFKTNNKDNGLTAMQMGNIISILEFSGYGNTNGNGAYNDFYIVVQYTKPGQQVCANCPPANIYQDTLYGSSCFDIMNCKACGAPQPACCGTITIPQEGGPTGGEGTGFGGGGGSVIAGRAAQSNGNGGDAFSAQADINLAVARGFATIDSSLSLYAHYSDAVTRLNQRMKLQKGDSAYVVALSLATVRSRDFQNVADAYLEFIEAYNSGSEHPEYLTDINAFVTGYAYLKSEAYAYLKYKQAVEYYNKRARILSSGEVTALSKTEFANGKYAKQSHQYVYYLSKTDPAETAHAKTMSAFATAADGKLGPANTNAVPDHCDTLYDAYVAAYNFYIGSTTFPNSCSSSAPALLTLQDFVSYNYCCVEPGYFMFNQLVNSFYNSSKCPEVSINPINRCEDNRPASFDDCIDLYNDYLQALSDFNQGAYAQQHGILLVAPFTDVHQFFEQGYCSCARAYLNYLENFTTSPLTETSAPPASIKDFTGCGDNAICQKEYDNYVAATNAYFDYVSHHPELHLPLPQTVPTAAVFTQNGYCNCANPYSAFLMDVVNGKNFGSTYMNSHIELSGYCTPTKVDCAQPSNLENNPSPTYTPSVDPCIAYQQALVKTNAKLLFEQAQEANTAIFISKYNAHCLAPVEKLLREYEDKEFHYTLYYYDQAGNLIKTVPPAGLDQNFYNSIKKYTDLNATRVKSDRVSRTKTVKVDHALVTNYVYNSLNQLVKQKLPDHDAIVSADIKYRYSLGVDTAVNVVASQFIDQYKGYLAGNVQIGNTYFPGLITRGMVFESGNGGDNWEQVAGLSGSDIKKIQFVDMPSGISYGFAVGSKGVFMVSGDGGNSWDQYPIHELSNGKTLNDIKVMSAVGVNNNLELMMVGENGKVIKGNLVPGNAPVFVSLNQVNPSGNFGANDNVTDVSGRHIGSGVFEYYITVLNTVTQRSKIYTCTSNQSAWTDVSGTRVADLNRVRYINGSNNCYAVGTDGTLLKSANSGGSWDIINTGTGAAIRDVYFADAINGVAVMNNSLGYGSLYKTTTGGSSWDLLEDGSASYNYTSLSPYYFSTNIDRLTAQGSNGLIKRVTINHPGTNVPGTMGAVSTLIGNNSSETILDVALVPYNNGAKLMAVASGNAGGVYYCSDYSQNSVSWQNAFTLTGQKLKKVTYDIINPNGNAEIQGLLLTDGPVPSGGRLIYFSCLPFSASAASGNLSWSNLTSSMFNAPYFTDLSYDLFSGASPNAQAYVIGQTPQGVSVMAPVSHNSSALNGIMVSGPNYYSITNAPNTVLKSVTVNSAANYAVAVGPGGEMYQIQSASTPFSGALTFNNKSNANAPAKLNDVQVNPSGSHVRVIGDDGYVATLDLVSANSCFTMATTGTANNYNAMAFYLQSGNKEMLLVGDNGLVSDAIVSANIMGATHYTLSNEHLNDVCISAYNTLPDVYFVGNNGAVVQSEMSDFYNGTAPTFNTVVMSSEENLNSAAYSPGAGNVVCVGNNSKGFNLSKQSALPNNNWFANEITNLHFTDADNGYVVGKKGLIKHTSDGGNNWQSVVPYVYTTANKALDLYAVFTTDADMAVVAGEYNYMNNISNTSLSTSSLSVSGANATKIIHDIDLSDDDNGFAVGTNYVNASTSNALAFSLVLANHQLVSKSPITVPGNIDGFRSLYAFKSAGYGRFMTVGKGATLKYYNGNFNTGITISPANFFSSSDNINTVDFADDKDGFIGGSQGKLGTVKINHATSTVDVSKKINSSTMGVLSAGAFEIMSLSVVDNGGISAFMGGNVSGSGKYTWKFGQQAGRYSTQFWYDRLGRLVVSQNAAQAPDRYSYTLYDAQGRIIEVGEKTENSNVARQFNTTFGVLVNGAINNAVIDESKLNAWISDASGARTQMTRSYYDISVFCGPNSGLPLLFNQENLRKRVATVLYKAVEDGVPANYQHATHYSYDIHGNVKSLIQENKDLTAVISLASTSQASAPHFCKRLDYNYDLVSGKVNRVSYQAGEEDAFYHEYEYDADNRLTEVKTSQNGLVWETDAKYFYYKHGPLARVEYGHDKVLGQDYAYTLQGWLKGVNSIKLDPNTDIGKDGGNSGPNQDFARDAMAYALGYFKNNSTQDYMAINPGVQATANRFEGDIGTPASPSGVLGARENLYNGNIGYMATSISTPANYNNTMPAPGFGLSPLPMANGYRYDQLNRLTLTQSFTNFNPAGNNWQAGGSTKYQNSFVYDANGNITSQKKYDQNSALFDDLTYRYDVDPVTQRPNSNRLHHVNDGVTSAIAAVDDIEDQGAWTAVGANDNYEYDAIGNLIKDKYEEIGNNTSNTSGGISWTVYGKIKEIKRNAGSTKKELKFDYDASGNRVAKHIFTPGALYADKSIYYVRDAQGNVMATYEFTNAIVNNYPVSSLVMDLKLTERPIYGSSRIGVESSEKWLINQAVVPARSINYQRLVGNKHFELSNHLGNVLTVLSDAKVPVPDAGGNIDYFVADLKTVNDYYAFGHGMAGREFNSGGYRYGFNGKENDNEVMGGGLSLDFGARICDSRLGRWLSVDPLQSKYPGLSPYNYTANNPIIFIDPDGREIWISYAAKMDGKILIQTVQYKNGELYTANGKKYEGSNVYFMKVQSQLNNLKKSNPDVNKMITELETSNNYHEITNNIERVHELTPQANIGWGTANYDISRQRMMNFKKNADGSTVEIIDNTVTYFPEPYNDNPDVQVGDKESILAHELKHAHDKQTGEFKKLESTTNSEGLKFSEISAVKAQNAVLKSKHKAERMKYGDKKISKEDFIKIK